MADLSDQSLRLWREAEQACLDFIWTDLDVILTFAAVAEAEYKFSNQEHAERSLAAAKKGYSDMLRFFSRAKGLTPEIERKFQSKFNQVRERLERLPNFR